MDTCDHFLTMYSPSYQKIPLAFIRLLTGMAFSRLMLTNKNITRAPKLPRMMKMMDVKAFSTSHD